MPFSSTRKVPSWPVVVPTVAGPVAAATADDTALAAPEILLDPADAAELSLLDAAGAAELSMLDAADAAEPTFARRGGTHRTGRGGCRRCRAGRAGRREQPYGQHRSSQPPGHGPPMTRCQHEFSSTARVSRGDARSDALDLRAGRWHHGVRLLDPGSSRCRASMAVVRR